MPQQLAYLNGQFLAQEAAHLAIHDAGFIFGATATDLCRTFNHRLFRLADHLARFRHSCTCARIPQPVPDNEIAEIAERLVAHNSASLGPGQDLALVMFATPGPIGYYAGQAGGPGDSPPTLGLHTFPLTFSRYRGLFAQGAHLVVPDRKHVPAACVDPSMKQRSRITWWLAEQEAHQIDPLASALLLDDLDMVTETAAANFLLVHRGAVLSPPRSSILGGISLQVVQELCSELKIPFAERALSLSECITAEEAFLSSTPYCVAGISAINGTSIPWPGRIFQQLLAAWSARVGVDISRQIFSNP